MVVFEKGAEEGTIPWINLTIKMAACCSLLVIRFIKLTLPGIG